jgi:hypothetical protein
MQALHDSTVGGHSEVVVTYIRIKRFFYWPQMKDNIHNWVSSCSVCQQAKAAGFLILVYYNHLGT